jgi:3-oxoadipate enol-lactonase
MTTVTASDGTELGFEVRGADDAPALVFAHSLGADRSMWRPQVEALENRYRIVLVDFRGHGRSAAPEGPYSIALLGDDVLRIADAAGAATFHFCGISLGGITGLWLAVHHPERVLSLVAANTAARIGSVESWEERVAAVRTGGTDSIREAVIGRWFAPGFMDGHPDWFAQASRVFSATDPAGYIGCCGALAVADLRAEVPAITAPVLVVGGSLDQATPPADAEWLHGAIAGSELTMLDGAAHLSNLDHADEFTQRLTRFLADHAL